MPQNCFPDRRGHPAKITRAVAYCEAHLAEEIAVTDIAVAARTSVRSLQENFRAHLNTTPLGYLRRLRLDRAHRLLVSIAQGHATGTVTDVALLSGFQHYGRFAAFYKQAYGCSPSQTLRPA